MKEKKRAIIIAHGDLDGIVSAIMRYFMLKDEYLVEDPVWSQPYWIAKKKYVGDLNMYDHIDVVDIALNNRNLKKVIKFISDYAHKLTWYDHHWGWSDFNICRTLPFKPYIDERAESCVSLIKRIHPNQEYPEKVNRLIRLAHETDKGNTNNLFHKALKINPKNNETRYYIFRYATSIPRGEVERQCLVNLKIKARKYRELERHTKKVIKKDSYVKGNVLFVDIRNYGYYPIDKTLLFFEGYEKKPFVVLKFLTKQDQECWTVATNTNKNLVKTFNLPSGQNFRITLFKPKMSDKDIVKKLS